MWPVFAEIADALLCVHVFPANALTHPQSCPHSLQPELKACAVQIVSLTVRSTLPVH